MRRIGVLLVAIAAVLPGAAGGGRQQAQLNMRLVASGFDDPVFVGAHAASPAICTWSRSPA